jgi:hypothetical protein
MSRALWTQLLLVGIGVAFIGCGSETGYNGPTGTVTGKVTFKGAAAPAGCAVTFWGTDKAGHIAVGSVGSDGSYSLRVSGSEKIPTGSYNVTVSPPASGPVDEKAIAEAMQSGDSSKMPKAVPPPFPAKFADATTSEIKLDVKECKNLHDIPLTE